MPKGKLLESVEELGLLARKKKAVVIDSSSWGSARHVPAAWAINFSGAVLLNLIHRQLVYEYKNEEQADAKDNAKDHN